LELPTSGLPWNPRRHTSPECWQPYGEVQGFELHHVELVRDYNQLAVDAYAAQHASRGVGGDVPPISVAYALVGLYLALDRGVSGLEVRAAHQWMGSIATSARVADLRWSWYLGHSLLRPMRAWSPWPYRGFKLASSAVGA
jgi:hypothetical protein